MTRKNTSLTRRNTPWRTELVCDDCLFSDHDECRRQGGWPSQDTNERCGCHVFGHALDNRQVS